MPGRARSQMSLTPSDIWVCRLRQYSEEGSWWKTRGHFYQMPPYGWWADETKGYRLEDAETGKLITARDVRFVENDAPGDLAVIETRGNALDAG